MGKRYVSEARTMSMDTCHQCGNEYKRISTHWTSGSCSHPELSEHQHEVIVGLLMGDGYLATDKKNPYMQVRMTSPDYLNCLSEDVFSIISNGVHLKRTATECAQRDRESGFNEDAKAENYSDIYEFRTMCHPGLQKYEKWYSTGEKVFPTDIKLTPTTLKHWFCGDGCLVNSKWPKITLCNESSEEEKINNLFNEAGLSDFFWNKTQKRNSGVKMASIYFREEGARKFYDYIGEPLPGFSYKWPEKGR